MDFKENAIYSFKKVKKAYDAKGIFGILKGLSWRIKAFPNNLKRKFHPKIIYYKLKSKNGVFIKEVIGGKISLDINDLGLSRDLIFSPIREEIATMQVKKDLKEGMNVLEIGANKGYYVLIESKEIGKKGKIFAFEPDPRSFELLKKTIKLNHLEDKVVLFNCAVGNENKEIDIFLSDHHNWSNLVRPPWQNKNFKIKKVDLVKIADILKNEKIDYVRMDVEGYEFEILKGMGNLLKNVKGMFIELHPHILKEKGEFEEFKNFIKNNGFSMKSFPSCKDHVFFYKKNK